VYTWQQPAGIRTPSAPRTVPHCRWLTVADEDVQMSYFAEEPRIETFCKMLFTAIDRYSSMAGQ
jgi:hypothetical protein